MYVDTEKYISKQQKEDLSVLLGSIHYVINSYGKWCSTHKSRLDYTSSDFEILYYSKGGSLTTINGKEYVCSPGSMLVLEPFSLVTSINKDYEEYEYYSIHFDIEPAYLQAQLSNVLTCNGPVILKEEYSELKGMFEKLHLEKERAEIGYLSIITSGLLRIIVEIIRVQKKRNPVEIHEVKYNKQQVNVVNSALHYVNKHKNEAIKMNDLCKCIGASNSYLYKAFIEVLGISPSKYVIQFKIKKAKELLRTHEFSIEEVGIMLGFSSPYHFSNTFKAITGTNPKKYELNMRGSK
ncbi:AraC family transcriptional regulator [Clostridium sp. CS001]|uniref:AraC family transcriptional regulator n=1 Tax=Clostridium sp. CS001 TaxID=2880648 RepID=UPI001CF0FDFB|nr:helix-turn-helix domain-containing protein [Clostridium sp. CS001]MCB2289088.1 AraC family transcriptional regulator [Clostridium sp. CS001]